MRDGTTTGNYFDCSFPDRVGSKRYFLNSKGLELFNIVVRDFVVNLHNISYWCLPGNSLELVVKMSVWYHKYLSRAITGQIVGLLGFEYTCQGSLSLSPVWFTFGVPKYQIKLSDLHWMCCTCILTHLLLLAIKLHTFVKNTCTNKWSSPFPLYISSQNILYTSKLIAFFPSSRLAPDSLLLSATTLHYRHEFK